MKQSKPKECNYMPSMPAGWVMDQWKFNNFRHVYMNILTGLNISEELVLDGIKPSPLVGITDDMILERLNKLEEIYMK